MQMIKVIPRGVYAKLYPAIVIGAKSAAEAIEGWSRQVGMKVADNRVMEALGFPDEKSLHAPTNVTEINLVPALYGGGGFGRIILGAALIVGGIFVMAMPGMQFVGKAMITVGIGLVVGGILQLFMKSPSTSGEDDPDASKYLGSGINTTAIGTPIPIGGGMMMLGGHFLSIQVNATDMAFGQFPTSPT